ncbi:MAG: rRNA maturation RNase YbeY [Flavitalea sp.]
MLKKKGKPTVNFHFSDAKCILPPRKKLKEYLVALFEEESTPLEQLDYIFCSDPYLRDINVKYLNHDYNTDIITFPLSAENESIQGEIYISIDTVKDNAVRFKTTFENELLRVIFHGALHLCGYLDKSPTDQKIMSEMEDKYLQQWYSPV